jgi:transcriptional regulator with PAS, ATPase and Fis domain
MREERFREDLFYRLRGIVLTVPPLRDRPEDLPLLVEHFRRLFNARHHLAIEGLTPGALRRLAAHRWPGNVRELEAVLEEAMVLQGEGTLLMRRGCTPKAPGSAWRAADSGNSTPRVDPG